MCNIHSDYVKGETDSVKAQTSHEVGKASALCTGSLYPQEIFPVQISVTGRPERLHHRESNLRSSGLNRSASTNCATAFPTASA